MCCRAVTALALTYVWFECGRRAKFSPPVGGRGVDRKLGVNWVSPKGKIYPFIGGRGFYHIPAFLDSRHQIASNTLDCLFPSNNFLPRTYYFFQISQPAKNWLKNKYFQEQIQWVPLRRLYRRLQCKDKYSISEFGKGLA